MAALAALLACAGCYEGEAMKGQPCVTDAQCGPSYACVEGFCGGVGCDLGPDQYTGECPCLGPDAFECGQMAIRSNKIDILFVFENAFADDMSTLARFVVDELRAGLVDTLRSRRFLDSLVEYRVAFTTTDSGNELWCPEVATSPERGEFVLSSCLERLAEFESAGIDATESCTASCELGAIATIPTAVEGQDPAPRAWIEGGPEFTNLAEGVAVEDALSCAMPQGIAGCGFEQQLESIRLALAKTADPSSANYGFVRSDASLLIVLVTTEVDTSYNPDWAEIFDPAGERVFWSDPTDNFPSSAIGWNAGVGCSGDGPVYPSCAPQDYEIGGAPTQSPADAVLYPVARYRDQLAELEASKKAVDDSLELIFAVVGGLPEGFPDTPQVYADSPDPEFQRSFGIGPACSKSGEGLALPIVRIRSVAEGFPSATGDNNLFSFCGESFDAVFELITDSAAATGLCLPGCAADKTQSLPGVQPECRLSYVDEGGEVQEVPFCDQDPQTGLAALGAGQPMCALLRVGAAISAECEQSGSNVQFAFVYADGVEPPSSVYANCEPSAQPELDCPATTFTAGG